MIKIITIVGARPQIIKAAAISRCIRNNFKNKIIEQIVHTGQHYDENMSEIFFREMEIPTPDYNLNVGSASHAVQTAQMMQRLEEVMLKEKPQCVLIYGDTNSTLAGSVTAAKLNIPVAHVEAGLRSYNRRMPEEINRIVSDHLSTFLFAPTQTAIHNLITEGIGANATPPFSPDHPGVFNSGDVMYDNAIYFAEKATSSIILKDLGLEKENFLLYTIHRDFNTDVPERLNAIFRSMLKIAKFTGLKSVVPLHPRTKNVLQTALEKNLYKSLQDHPLIHIVPPVSFLDMISLEKNAFIILTDSGGVQKEAYFYKKPCIILRPETEWVELVQSGAAVIADCDEDLTFSSLKNFQKNSPEIFPDIFGNGMASEQICNLIANTL